MRALVRPGSGRWSAVAYVAAFLMLAVLGFFYTNHVQRESGRKWCSVIVILDEAARVTPPANDLDRQFRAAIERLRRDVGC